MAGTKHTAGPWAVGYRAIDVVCVNAKCGGTAKLFDVRGWGYLTGTGHGGLGLSDEEAYEIQKANAALAAAAPDMLAALIEADADLSLAAGIAVGYDLNPLLRVIRAAIAKAEGSSHA